MKKNSTFVCDCDAIHLVETTLAKNNMLENSILSQMTTFYKAFADYTRIKIINLLDDAELCVCDISWALNMTKSSVSHQLKYLKEINLVKSKKIGKEVWYSLADNHVKQIFDICLEHILEENGK